QKDILQVYTLNKTNREHSNNNNIENIKNEVDNIYCTQSSNPQRRKGKTLNSSDCLNFNKSNSYLPVINSLDKSNTANNSNVSNINIVNENNNNDINNLSIKICDNESSDEQLTLL